MRRNKVLIALLAVLLVGGFASVALGATQDKATVQVRATWSLEIVKGKTVPLKFTGNDYNAGASINQKATLIKVVSPTSNWQMRAVTGYGFNHSVKQLKLRVHGKGWEKLNGGKKKATLLNKNQTGDGENKYWIDYRVDTNDITGEVSEDIPVTFKII